MTRARTDPNPVARCTCRHIVTTHKLNGKGQRVNCSAARCDCRLFVNAAVKREAECEARAKSGAVSRG